MRRRETAIWIGMVLLGGCNRTPERQPQTNVEQPANFAESPPQPPIPPPGTGPDAKTPLSEPKGPIDPKSAEAAGQVVQHYGALIEQGRFAEARALWSDDARASAIELEVERLSEVHLEIGKPSDMEGAAGSAYVTVPGVFYGKLEEGEPFRRPAEILLRRVNDVPGSTAEQRRWHIERIDWKAAR